MSKRRNEGFGSDRCARESRAPKIADEERDGKLATPRQVLRAATCLADENSNKEKVELERRCKDLEKAKDAATKKISSLEKAKDAATSKVSAPRKS